MREQRMKRRRWEPESERETEREVVSRRRRMAEEYMFLFNSELIYCCENDVPHTVHNDMSYRCATKWSSTTIKAPSTFKHRATHSHIGGCFSIADYFWRTNCGRHRRARHVSQARWWWWSSSTHQYVHLFLLVSNPKLYIFHFWSFLFHIQILLSSMERRPFFAVCYSQQFFDHFCLFSSFSVSFHSAANTTTTKKYARQPRVIDTVRLCWQMNRRRRRKKKKTN